MQPTFSMKNPISLHYAHNVFFNDPICTKSHAPFEKWTFIFVHFWRAMPILFWTFIESDRVVY
jgi:hypothetical protein